jgi:ankyrin repeat protein
VAAFEGHDEVVRFLLDRGADVNAHGGLWNSALEAAAGQGHDSTVRLLLEKGADVNIKECHALHEAGFGGQDTTL